MSKISALAPPPLPISGDEKVPVVQGNGTYGLPLGQFLEDTVSQAAAAAAVAAAGTVSGFTLINGIRYTQGHISVGVTPGNVRYEMNSGGQPMFTEKVFHVASVGADRSVMEGFAFNNTGKPLTIQFGKNRGDGIPGSATFGRKTLAGDRLFLLALYGGRDSDGTTTAFAHAGYLSVDAEADNNGSNEQDSHIHLRPGSTAVGLPGAGNGLELNSKMQAALAGPNRAQYGPGFDHKAIFHLGPGGTEIVPARLTPATLKTDPEEGAVELDGAGVFFITQGLTGALKRRAIETNLPSAAITPSGVPDFITAELLASGMGWARVRLTVLAADYSAVGGICDLNFATAFPAIPIVIGSRDQLGGTSLNGNHEFTFGAKNAGRISISMMSGTLLAGQTYAFNLFWKIP